MKSSSKLRETFVCNEESHDGTLRRVVIMPGVIMTVVLGIGWEWRRLAIYGAYFWERRIWLGSDLIDGISVWLWYNICALLCRKNNGEVNVLAFTRAAREDCGTRAQGMLTWCEGTMMLVQRRWYRIFTLPWSINCSIWGTYTKANWQTLMALLPESRIMAQSNISRLWNVCIVEQQVRREHNVHCWQGGEKEPNQRGAIG